MQFMMNHTALAGSLQAKAFGNYKSSYPHNTLYKAHTAPGTSLDVLLISRATSEARWTLNSSAAGGKSTGKGNGRTGMLNCCRP